MYMFLLFVAGVLFISYFILVRNLNYWRNRNVPYVKPLPIIGNFKDSILLKKHINVVVQEMCKQFPKEPYIGSFYGTSPTLIIQDLELIKLVLSKDFYYCNGREVSEYENELFVRNMFFTSGDRWKVLRTNLSPLFTSVKLKNMFYLIKNCSDSFDILLAEEIKRNPNIDVKKLLARYTMDCITNCAFGFDSETMKQSEQKNAFTDIASKLFDRSVFGVLKIYGRAMWPGLFYTLGFKMLNDDVGMFFTNVIAAVFKQREETKSVRNDFIDLLLNWKTDSYISGDSLKSAEIGGSKKISIEVDNDLLISQCVMLFGAGFETTSSTLSFALFELAKNCLIQEKVIKEVDEYFAQHESIEYDCISAMPYTEACIAECLRLYPVLGVMTREVMHDYTLPTGLSLRKGVRIHIPVYHIHHNPDYFPEPQVFCPERFLGDRKKNIKAYSHMPFGEGPRTCIGMRFSKMPMHAVLLKIFKNYRVELAQNMPHKITLNPKSFTSESISGIHIQFIPRKTENN